VYLCGEALCFGLFVIGRLVLNIHHSPFTIHHSLLLRVFDLLPQKRHLLSQVVVTLGEPRQGDGVPDGHHEEEEDTDQEQKRWWVEDADGEGRHLEDAARDGQEDDEQGGGEPEQGVFFPQSPLPYQPDDECEDAAGERERNNFGPIHLLGFPGEHAAPHGIDDQRQGDLQHVVGGFPSGDGGVTREPAAHEDRDLHDAQAAPGRGDDRFHLGVVVGVEAGEELDGPLPVAAETRGRVLDGLTREKPDQAVEDPASQPAGEPHLVAARQRAGADHQVRLAPFHEIDDLEDLVGPVLAVAVELDGEVVAALAGELEPGLDGAADAEVEGVGDDMGAETFGDGGRFVRRAVVHHQQVAAKTPEVLEHRVNVLSLVIRWDYGQNLHVPSLPGKSYGGRTCLKTVSTGIHSRSAPSRRHRAAHKSIAIGSHIILNIVAGAIKIGTAKAFTQKNAK